MAEIGTKYPTTATEVTPFQIRSAAVDTSPALIGLHQVIVLMDSALSIVTGPRGIIPSEWHLAAARSALDARIGEPWSPLSREALP